MNRSIKRPQCLHSCSLWTSSDFVLPLVEGTPQTSRCGRATKDVDRPYPPVVTPILSVVEGEPSVQPLDLGRAHGNSERNGHPPPNIQEILSRRNSESVDPLDVHLLDHDPESNCFQNLHGSFDGAIRELITDNDSMDTAEGLQSIPCTWRRPLDALLGGPQEVNSVFFLSQVSQLQFEHIRVAAPSNSNDAPRVPSPSRSRQILLRIHDVICERGSFSNNHDGNRAYLQYVRERQDEYEGIQERVAKTAFSKAIVDWVHGRGGRFLQRDDPNGPWYEVPDNIARKKVARALRD